MRPRFYRMLPGGKVEPIPDGDEGLLEWAVSLENAERHIAYDDIAPGVSVSTVFMGLDSERREDKPPLLFETMTFGEDFEYNTQRYTTYGQALAGHAQACEFVREQIAKRQSETPVNSASVENAQAAPVASSPDAP